MTSFKCSNCRGQGILTQVQTCPECKGVGYSSLVIGVGNKKGDECQTCSGKGKLVSKDKCPECDGKGTRNICDFCGTELDTPNATTCATCEENPIVIKLEMPIDTKYLDGSRALAGKIKEISSKGVIVDLGQGFLGYFKSDMKVNEGQTIAVRLRHPITLKDRGNGKTIPVYPINSKNFRIVKKQLPVNDMNFEQLRGEGEAGTIGRVLCQITKIFVIQNGPTIFDLIDINGEMIQGQAYADNNKQAFPLISTNTVVKMVGKFRYYNEEERIQIYSLEKASGLEALDFMDELARINQKNKSKINENEFFVESIIYEQMKDKFVEAAIKIRGAILRNQNIIIRYHAPCIDGITGAYAIDFAIKRYLATKGSRQDEFRRLVRRIPQRNPHFEVREASRDLSFVLDNQNPVLPLYILLDVGSSEESKPALDLCRSYGVDVIIIDHHTLSDGIEEKAFCVINPNKIDDNNSITSGMIATELAKFIASEQDTKKRIIHLAALAGYSDRVDGLEINKYYEFAEEFENDTDRLENMMYALDYVSFGLRFYDGGEIYRNILGISGVRNRTNSLIESITPTAKSLFAKALKVVKSYAVNESLNDDCRIQLVDLDNDVPKYEYPAHSDLLTRLHFDTLEDYNGRLMTIGHSSDFMILRSSDIQFNFNNFLEKLTNELPDFWITGSGHRSVGSIQFISKDKDQILEKIKKLLK